MRALRSLSALPLAVLLAAGAAAPATAQETPARVVVFESFMRPG
jgi:hypothetical protein